MSDSAHTSTHLKRQKQKKHNKCIIRFIYVLFFLFYFSDSFCQQPATMDFEVENEKLSTALNSFSKVSGINLSYNAGDAIYSNIVSFKASNQPPLTILKELLAKSGQKFKKIGNQVVIFDDPNNNGDNNNAAIVTPVPIPKEKQYLPKGNKRNPKTVMDTVFIVDTVFVSQIDTLKIIDTVFLEKETPVKKQTKIKSIPVDLFDKSITREQGWYTNVFLAPVLSDYSLVKNKKSSYRLNNYSVGIGVNKIVDKWNLGIGIGYTHYAEKFTHNYTITDGGFFVVDTIDPFYTFDGVDTLWYYATDSIWKPEETHAYTYDLDNRIGVFEIYVSASYDFYVSNNIRWYLKGSLLASAVLEHRGMAFLENSTEGSDIDDLKFEAPILSGLVGVGAKFQISKQLDFVSEIYYFSSFDNTVAVYKVDTKMRGAGLKLGINYYF